VDARGLQSSPLGTHTAIYVSPQQPDLINYGALGIPAGTSAFTIGFYAGGNGYLVPSAAYSGGSTNQDVSSQAMADFHKANFQGAYPFQGLSPEEEAQAVNSMAAGVRDYNGTVRYPLFGLDINSNSGAYTLATMAGLGRQFQSYQLPFLSVGRGQTLPAQSFNAQGQASLQRGLQITALQLQVAQLQLQIIQLQTANANSTPQRVIH